MMDEILSKFGLKYTDLLPEEKQVLSKWLDDLKTNEVTIEKIKAYFNEMRRAVEDEITKYDLTSKHILFLQARLKNYMLFVDFLSSYDKAKAALEIRLKAIKKQGI
jgi:hypothetical protein